MFPCTITCSLICSLKYSLGVKAVELLTQADCPTARGLCWDLLQIQWSSAYEIARADDAGGTSGRMSTIFGSYGQPKVWTIQRGEHGCFFHANQASCYMLLWRKHGYRTEENLESHGVHFAEAKGFTKSQDTCYRAHYWDVLVEVWILDSFESRSHRHCTKQRLQVSFSSIIAASTGYLLICLLRHEDPTHFFSSSVWEKFCECDASISTTHHYLEDKPWGQGEQRNKLILHFKQVSDCKWTN